MSNDKDNKRGKIGGISGTGSSKGIEKASNIGHVDQVKKTDAIAGTGAIGGVSNRKPTTLMTAADRQRLFSMIDEEAEKLLGQSGLSPEHRKAVQDAVKMAVDAATVDEEEN